ncbi:MAG: hypothetical protein RL094_559 [Candidatus Parcubacteria bacterium]
MKNFFIKYFVSHDSNHHHPHLLRESVASVLLGAVLIIEVVFLSHSLILLPRNGMFAQVLSLRVVDFTNIERSRDKLRDLTPNAVLQQAAQAKANDMASKQYFSHTGPDGTSPWSWFEKAGYDYKYAGENLAINFFDSKDVVNAWMNSQTHRENILNKNFTEIGIATAEGRYNGYRAIFIVEFFGTPKVVAASGTVDKVGDASKDASTVSATQSASVFGAVAGAPRTVISILFTLLAFVITLVLLGMSIWGKLRKNSSLTIGLLMILVIAIILAFNEVFAGFFGRVL